MTAPFVEMPAQTMPIETMPIGRLFHAYLTEARYESLRMLRSMGFSLPFLLLPVGLFLLFGVLMFGDAVRKDPDTGRFLFTAFAVMGVMGPAMFGFGAAVSADREQGLLTLKRALPAPPGSYLLAKMLMAMLFAAIVMTSMVAAARGLGHVRLNLLQCLSATATAILGAMPFCAIGLFIGTRIGSKGAIAMLNVIYVPMMHVSGLFYPLPKVLRTVAPLWPSYHLQQLVLGITGAPAVGSPMVHAASLAGVTLVLGVFAVRRLARVG
jgi:ABC-2 type transport system permease protein